MESPPRGSEGSGNMGVTQVGRGDLEIMSREIIGRLGEMILAERERYQVGVEQLRREIRGERGEATGGNETREVRNAGNGAGKRTDFKGYLPKIDVKSDVDVNLQVGELLNNVENYRVEYADAALRTVLRVRLGVEIAQGIDPLNELTLEEMMRKLKELYTSNEIIDEEEAVIEGFKLDSSLSKPKAVQRYLDAVARLNGRYDQVGLPQNKWSVSRMVNHLIRHVVPPGKYFS